MVRRRSMFRISVDGLNIMSGGIRGNVGAVSFVVRIFAMGINDFGSPNWGRMATLLSFLRSS